MDAERPSAGEAGARGSIAWMVRSRVTPNILMVALLVGGMLTVGTIQKEVFPEFEEDSVSVSVRYPGASPEDVEQGIVLAVEEAVRGLPGVAEVRAQAAEGSAQVTVELLAGADRQRVYQEVRQEVARITTLPLDAEEPVITLDARRREVLDVYLHGDVDEWTLRNAVEAVRERLLAHPGITQVELEGARDYEILVEVPVAALRTHGLTVEQVAATLSRSAIDRAGGSLETAAGEVLLRLTQRADWARQFADIPLVATEQGALVRLGDVARVREGFEETDRGATFDGRRAIGISVFRVGDETPTGVRAAVDQALAEAGVDVPEGIDWAILNDRSEIYRQRLELLLRNGALGLALVLLLLGAFLEFKLAFWVTMGIPISFLGGLLLMPLFGVSINMISMFAFIVALGIVVDDAIVAGENIYEYRQRGMGLVAASVQGARDIATPITFSILTNIVAFLPLYFVPGTFGKIWRVIPLVVCTVFVISLLEALWVLPSHLAHTRSRPGSRLTGGLHRLQQRFSLGFSTAIERGYGPLLSACLRHRGLTLAASAALLLLTAGFLASGRMGFVLMPKVEADYAAVEASLPPGSPPERVEAVRDRLIGAARGVVAAHGGAALSEGLFARVDESSVDLRLFLTPPEVRPLSTSAVTALWREAVGEVAGLEGLRFESDRGGPGRGPALTVELSHAEVAQLDAAASALAGRLEEFSVTKDVDDGYTPGKAQLDFRVNEVGRGLGLTASDIARQVRYAFQGIEAIRQQRGRNEVTVRVLRPEAERVSEADLENMIVRTPDGGEVPLAHVASVERGRSFTRIDRRDGRRTVTVTAGVEPQGETTRVQAVLDTEILPALMRDFPGLAYGYEGRQADMRESLEALLRGIGVALLCVYVLLAIPFRSYAQPLIVMLSIPFGIVGATLGHLLMGYDLSVVSMMGVVALAGVVVNDSLVLVDYANRLVGREGLGAREAVWRAGVRRFRPILLTTLTTFGGLAPMIFETSRQARFMIPMAVSLGFGILFATAIVLVLVPTLYLTLDDATRWLAGAVRAPAAPRPGGAELTAP